MQTPPLPTLPFHLTLSLSAWISSTIASACLRNASPQWKELSHPFANALEALPAEVSAKGSDNLRAFLEGIATYTASPYVRELPDPPVIWRQGNARLLDYSSPATSHQSLATLLFVPSLINRHYILDLAPGRSLVRWLASQGIQTLVLDWGVPGKAEVAYNCADYVSQVLLPAIRFVHETSGEKVTLAGYCMGGVLALAAAQLEPKAVRALALLATPWDFHAKDVSAPRLDEATLTQLEQWIGTLDALPSAHLQMLFYWNDPWLFHRKFRQFATLKPGSKAFREFMALEHWVNDGVPLSHGAAQDCLIEWGQRNQLMSGGLARRSPKGEDGWQVAGKVIDPKKIRMPCFAAAPKQDRIVPTGCALPLARALRGCTLIEPSSGHVGMIVGSKAKNELWEPLRGWLRKL